MLGKVLASSSLVAFVLLSAILQSTSPSTIHPVGILFVFILLYVLALGVLTFFVFGISRVMISVVYKDSAHSPLTLQQSYYYGSAIALAPVILIGMRSIGHTGFYEIALVIVFELIACFYISKR
jgi:hypothetical protein